jgi:hypothetical protein
MIKRRHGSETGESRLRPATMNVVLPLALKEELQRRAEAGERSVSAEIRLAVKSWLQHSLPPPAKRSAANAGRTTAA